MLILQNLGLLIRVLNRYDLLAIVIFECVSVDPWLLLGLRGHVRILVGVCGQLFLLVHLEAVVCSFLR